MYRQTSPCSAEAGSLLKPRAASVFFQPLNSSRLLLCQSPRSVRPVVRLESSLTSTASDAVDCTFVFCLSRLLGFRLCSAGERSRAAASAAFCPAPPALPPPPPPPPASRFKSALT